MRGNKGIVGIIVGFAAGHSKFGGQLKRIFMHHAFP